MTLTDILFQLLIRPIEIVLEVVYGIANTLTGNIGLSILALSFFINVVLLPFYKMADAIQKEERDTEKKLEYWKNHINKTFSGDEKIMMLQTYYRQNNYKPYYSLKSILPLFLEVPFFLAAYHFLSHLEELQGTSFLFLKNLGMPDALLTIGGLSINLLPVLMTVINIISSSIYTKGAPLKEKVQLYGMALLFLVLLYDSPSGLVLYWTANNTFSLIKNIIQSLKIPSTVINTVFSVIGLVGVVVIIPFYHPIRWKHKAVAILICLILTFPKIIEILKKRFPARKERLKLMNDASCFRLGAVCMALLTGTMISSAVVKSSPAEFVLVSSYQTPLIHVVNATLIAVGFFVIWMGIFYRLSNSKTQPWFTLGVWIICWCALANYMFFGTDKGTLTSELTYVGGLAFSRKEILINLFCIAVITLVAAFIYIKKPSLVKSSLAVLCISIIGLSAVNIAGIQSAVPEIKHVLSQQTDEKANFTLSKEGKNVVVIMLDRAISSFLPVILDEKPELQEKLDGFVYYPNTISHGGFTAFGAPGLFGGYEYTPAEMNARTDQKIRDKHDEALKVMPVLFDENGFEVTICDPPYAGYTEIPDLSIYSDYPQFRTFLTENGQFRVNIFSNDNQDEYIRQAWRRNFFCYGMMKVVPLIIQGNLYKDGSYYNNNERAQVHMGMSTANGKDPTFVNSYSVLYSLPQMTNIVNDDSNHFMMMANLTTHSPALLQEPEYSLSPQIDNTEYDAEHEVRHSIDGRDITLENYYQMSHYHINMAAIQTIGDWCDYLRKNDVYDSTRIIIVADHGRDLGVHEEMILGDGPYDDTMYYNPLLMVKDFGAKGFSIENTFMTNADVPSLALQGIVDHPVNPFTGNEISMNYKEHPVQYILTGIPADPRGYEEVTFPKYDWYTVHDNLFDTSNWKLVKEN